MVGGGCSGVLVTREVAGLHRETIALINGPSDYDGVLVNKSGEVVASWASFA